ncbi:MAG: hypothetical protein PHG25_02395 [Candidatus Pacebacteria bacterium]|nr:hypothetical protein [Candidatus Paceibacterota bacterium]
MSALVTDLLEVFKEMMSAFFEIIPKVLHVCLWAITGVFILPCVFVANHFFPKWVKWGEDF